MISTPKNTKIFGSKVSTRLIIEGVFFCPHEMKYLAELPTMTIENPTLSAAADLVNFSHYRHLRGIWIHSIILYSQIHSILTNKANFPHFSPKNDDFTKNKPNSKPIQTQFKPKQTQFKPIQTQFKANYFKGQK